MVQRALSLDERMRCSPEGTSPDRQIQLIATADLSELSATFVVERRLIFHHGSHGGHGESEEISNDWAAPLPLFTHASVSCLLAMQQ